MKTFPSLLCLCLSIAASTTRAQTTASSPLLQAMQEELTRSFATLKEQPIAPYYLSYEITETQAVNVGASFGVGHLEVHVSSSRL